MPSAREIIVLEEVVPRILSIRGHNVILDMDLARLYGTTTKALNQAVKRNAGRFPAEFMFRLTDQESRRWSQIVTTSGR